MKTRFIPVTRILTLLLLGLMFPTAAATIPFAVQNGSAIRGTPPHALALPHLVLFQNGVLSEAVDRTPILKLAGIDAPPTGVTVTLTLETQHIDPDLGESPGQRIRLAGLDCASESI